MRLHNNVGTSLLIDPTSARLVVNIPGVSPKREIEPAIALNWPPLGSFRYKALSRFRKLDNTAICLGCYVLDQVSTKCDRWPSFAWTSIDGGHYKVGAT